MKISAFLLFCCLVNIFAAPTYSQATKISLNLKDATIEDVLNKIEDVSEFYFLYNNKLIDVTRKVNIEADNEPIKDILNDILSKDTKFIVYDRQIILTPTDLTSLSEAMQQQKISGTVTDEKGNPLPGVTVLVKGSTTGTLTDASGKYILDNPPKNPTLIFSFVGMTTQEVPSEGRILIDAVLKEEAIGLDEVVVIGYGTQKRQSITSAVGSVTSSEVVVSPSANVSNIMVGRITGITAIQNQGFPGRDQSSLYIRGLSTTGNNSPLYVIDGIPREAIDFQRLAATEIDNISVLKDAAAAAVYGARGANGVILITTKRGSSQKASFSYSVNYGLQKATRLPNFLDSYRFADLYNKALVNEGKPALYTDEDLAKFKDGSDPIFHPNTDWLSVFNGTAPMYQHNLSATGGNEKVTYYLSFNYFNQKSLVSDKFDFIRYNFRSNIDARVTNTTKVALDVSGYMSKRSEPGLGYGYGDPTRVPAVYAGKYPNGLWGPGLSNRNPWACLEESGYSNAQNDGLFTRLELLQDISFIKGLSVKGVVAFDYKPDRSKTWQLPVVIWQAVHDGDDIRYIQTGGFGLPTLSDNMGIGKNFIVETHAMYNRSFNKHNVSGLVLFSQQKTSYEYLGASRYNYLTNQLDIIDAGGKTSMVNSGFVNEYHRQSVVGRLTYNYDLRYLLEFNFRYDGSDLFAQGKRFGFFPSASVGWIISKEEFMKNISFIDNLKIRGSYGTLGNDLIGQYQYLAFYTYGNGISMGSGSDYQDNLSLSRVQNTDVTWEKSRKTNIGFEALLLRNFTLEADLFWEKRNDILGKRSGIIPDYLGISTSKLPYENFQKVNNKGIEMALGYNKYFLNGINIQTRFNFTHSTNTVIDIGEAVDKPARIREEGRPLNAQFGYIALGLFQSEQAITEAYGNNYPNVKPGDIHYKDLNGDKLIDGNDITYIGSSNLPVNIFGFNSNISYKSIEFSMLWQAGTGNQLYLSTWLAQVFQGIGNALVAHLDYWRPDNPDAKYPRVTTTSSWNNDNKSSFWQYDMKYLRLKNIEIAYSLPKNITNRLHMQNLRVYFNAENLLLFSTYKEVDPEISGTSNSIYPQQVIYNIGAQISF